MKNNGLFAKQKVSGTQCSVKNSQLRFTTRQHSFTLNSFLPNFNKQWAQKKLLISFDRKNQDKMLLKSTLGVNFINIKRMNFSYERLFGNFHYVHVTRKKAAKTTFVQKILVFNVDEIGALWNQI